MTTPLRDGLLYFNPRSHEGSDEDGSSLTAVTIGISIHAPTRGATGLCGWNPRIDTISIHAPTRGATGNRLWSTKIYKHFNPRSHKGSDDLHGAGEGEEKDFNPRSHKGSDLHSCYPDGQVKGISIHAPTRGATFAAFIFIIWHIIFQSTLPQGERRPGGSDPA